MSFVDTVNWHKAEYKKRRKELLKSYTEEQLQERGGCFEKGGAYYEDDWHRWGTTFDADGNPVRYKF